MTKKEFDKKFVKILNPLSTVHPQCPLQDTKQLVILTNAQRVELLEALEEDIFELDDTFIYRTDETLQEIVINLNKLHKALGGKE